MNPGHTHFAGKVCIVKDSGLVMERQASVCGAVAYAVKSPHKIKVPAASSELAVGDCVVAQFLLLFNKLGDSFVLNRRKLLSCDFAVKKFGSCLFQIFRAQKTAHMVISERCFDIHKILPSFAQGINYNFPQDRHPDLNF